MLRYFCFVLAYCGALTLACAQSGITLTDMNGRDVTIQGPVKNTVAVPMPAGVVFATVAQGTEALAGVHDSTHKNLPTMLLPSIFANFADVRHDITRGSGFAPNVEALLEIQPDLVWQWGNMGQELLAPLEAAGFQVAALRYGTEEQSQRWMELFAQSIGQPERGASINAWRNAMRAKVQAQVAQVPEEQRQKVMHLSRYKTGMTAAGKTGLFQADITIAGGRNVNASNASAPAVNIEQILLWNPSVIILGNFEHDLTPQTIYEDPMFSDVDAVRNKRVYKIPAGGYYWEAPSQDSPLYWVWLAKLMYPEQVQLNLRDEIRSAYTALYGFEINEQQIDRVLHLALNSVSSQYAKSFGAIASLASAH